MCIVLVIWWVHVREGFQSSDDSAFDFPAFFFEKKYLISSNYRTSPFGFVTIDGDTTEAKLGQGIINALIIIAVIIVMTIIFVILFWFGFHKVEHFFFLFFLKKIITLWIRLYLVS